MSWIASFRSSRAQRALKQELNLSYATALSIHKHFQEPQFTKLIDVLSSEDRRTFLRELTRKILGHGDEDAAQVIKLILDGLRGNWSDGRLIIEEATKFPGSTLDNILVGWYLSKKESRLTAKHAVRLRFQNAPDGRGFSFACRIAAYGRPDPYQESFDEPKDDCETFVCKTLSKAGPDVISTLLSDLQSALSRPEGPLNLHFVFALTRTCAEEKRTEFLPLLAHLATLKGKASLVYAANSGLCLIDDAPFENLHFCIAVYFHLAAFLGRFEEVFAHQMDSSFKAYAREVLENRCDNLTIRKSLENLASPTGSYIVGLTSQENIRQSNEFLGLSLQDLGLGNHFWFDEINRALSMTSIEKTHLPQTRATEANNVPNSELKSMSASEHSHPHYSKNDNLQPGETRVNSRDGLTYIWIPPGTFEMGCSLGDSEAGSDEEPAHTVTITKGFWMGQTPVTQDAYQRIMGTNPSRIKGSRLPVTNVCWDDAVAYCTAIGMRLPSEAEWEYAARAGSKAPRYGDINLIAWYKTNLKDVAQKQPNAWRLYDMLGNVWEWIADWYEGNYYSHSPMQDPRGPASNNGLGRVLRGGSFVSDAQGVRASSRNSYGPTICGDIMGFRCVGEALP